MTENDQVWEDAADNLMAVAELVAEGFDLEEVPPIHLHNLYLLTSWLYHKRDVSLLPDADYDRICRYLLEYYEAFKEVVWWPERTLDPDLLRAGTGYALDVPRGVFEIGLRVLKRRPPAT